MWENRYAKLAAFQLNEGKHETNEVGEFRIGKAAYCQKSRDSFTRADFLFP